MTSKVEKETQEKIENPKANFSTPKEVAETEHLTKSQKAETLENWEDDARRLAVATEEGMSGGESSHVADVAEAQASLGVKGRKSRSPTKIG